MTAHGRSVVTSWAVIDRPYSDSLENMCRNSLKMRV